MKNLVIEVSQVFKVDARLFLAMLKEGSDNEKYKNITAEQLFQELNGRQQVLDLSAIAQQDAALFNQVLQGLRGFFSAEPNYSKVGSTDNQKNSATPGPQNEEEVPDTKKDHSNWPEGPLSNSEFPEIIEPWSVKPITEIEIIGDDHYLSGVRAKKKYLSSLEKYNSGVYEIIAITPHTVIERKKGEPEPKLPLGFPFSAGKVLLNEFWAAYRLLPNAGMIIRGDDGGTYIITSFELLERDEKRILVVYVNKKHKIS